VTSPPSKGAGLPALIAIGLVAGFLSGLLGVGGGIVLVPLMVAVLHYDQHTAHATSLAAIFIIALAGAVTFAVSGEVDLPLAIALGIGGVIGSTVGATTMKQASTRTLQLAFTVLLTAAGVRMVLGGAPMPVGAAASSWGTWLIGGLIGLAAGFASGLAGIGGGVIMVPAMVIFLGTSQHTAQGTSLLAILVTSLAGTRVNLKNGLVRLRPALTMGVAGAVAAPLGALAALAIASDQLARWFGLFLLFMAARSFRRILWGPKGAIAEE
jgi:uncharacterized membrane protein YfcA